MTTTDLIDLLASYTPAVPPGASTRKLRRALAVGGAVTLAVVTLWLGCQPLEEAARQPWFWMKAGYTGLLTAAGAIMVKRLSAPDGHVRNAPVAALAVVLAMLALGTSQILAAAPADRLELWLGHTWKVCSPLILLLAAPIYGCVVIALRALAPTRPALAGAAAGLAAGALSATLYELHCPEQTAAFVATWYTSAIAAAAALGALAGLRLLRW